ncbi:MAG: S-layer homology domain-containing protein [Clostridia bacterium]|nr:S-layer homology domain-containing protein [Clostridia bacterium]
MKKTFKRLTAVLLTLAFMLTSAPVAFAGIGMDIGVAYEECAAMYPEFVDAVLAQGATESQIINFLGDVQSYLLSLDVEVTEDNFEDYFIEAILDSMSKRKHMKLRDALVGAFPGAALDGMDGIIAPEFQPLVETIKLILFAEVEDETEEPTTEEETEEITTEAPTEPETEPVTKPTEPETDAPTEPATQPTEPETDAPTEPEKEPETEPATNPGKEPGIGGPDYGDEGEEATQPSEEASTEPKIVFTDIKDAPWAEKAIYALVNSGIINGYPDKTFKPNNPVTRAEFSKMITLASGRYSEKDKATYVSSFWDVAATEWHYTYVSAAYKFGFITGRSTTIFDPNSNITRGDLCLIVYRYIKSINPEFKAKTNADGTAITFGDAAAVPSWDVEAVNALYSTGVAPLRDAVNNKFEPTLPATRAECAVIIHNAMNAALGLLK